MKGRWILAVTAFAGIVLATVVWRTFAPHASPRGSRAIVAAPRASTPTERPAGASPQVSATATIEKSARPGSDPSLPASRGLLYGRVTTTDGEVLEGRLRWGGNEEAFWDDPFNGRKSTNRWVDFVAPEALPTKSGSFELFGLAFGGRERPADLRRPFVARFGDLSRVETLGRTVIATLKSGAQVELDRFEAGDVDDGLRVFRGEGPVDLGSPRVAAVDFLPTPPLDSPPARLRGTVRTTAGEFRGFVTWGRNAGLADDEVRRHVERDGRDERGPGSAPRMQLGALRSIVRGGDAARALRRDGGELELDERRADRTLAVQVEDPRFGRIQVEWRAFEEVDFDAVDPGADAESGPGYDDFAPGRPLSGRVVARDGRTLAGRIVFDLDENETTDTLDASLGGIDYALPFARVAAIERPAAEEGAAPSVRVTLRDGETLAFEPEGDLGPGNAGLLVFGSAEEATEAAPTYVPWPDVVRLELDDAAEPERAAPRGDGG